MIEFITNIRKKSTISQYFENILKNFLIDKALFGKVLKQLIFNF